MNFKTETLIEGLACDYFMSYVDVITVKKYIYVSYVSNIGSFDCRCNKEQAKYTCPRCNLGYCGLSCYRHKEHSDCSEAFYKECCMEALEDQDVRWAESI